MRLPFILPAVALITTGAAALGQDRTEELSGAEKLHSHLTRIFAGSAESEPSACEENAGVAGAAGECCEEVGDCCETEADCDEARASGTAAPVVSRAQQGERGFMGVQMRVEDGAMVIVGVIDGSPASKAGLEAGDRILRIGDHEIADQGTLTEYLAGIGPGQTRRLAVERNGWTKELDLTFAARTDMDLPESPAPSQGTGPRDGQSDARPDGDARQGLREKIRSKLRESRDQGEEKKRSQSKQFLFQRDDEASDEDTEIHVDIRQEDSHEPQVRIRINGEDVDVDELVSKGLSGLHVLGDLEGLDGLVELKDLHGLKELRHLKGLKGLEGLVELEGLEGLGKLKGLGKLHLRHGQDEHHDGDDHIFQWSTEDGREEVAELREELRALRAEMRELRRERLSEVERLREEVQSLLRSLDR